MEGNPTFEGAPDPDKGGTPGEMEKEFYEMLERDRIHKIQELKLEISKIRGMQDVLNDLFKSGKSETSATFDELLNGLATYQSPEPPRKAAARDLRGALNEYKGKLPNTTAGEFFAWLTERHNELMEELIKTIKPEEQAEDETIGQ
ncbi:MAG: hypothetical protein Q7R85_04090 [bacterium]|nr:hypothetical protein [bacterium]